MAKVGGYHTIVGIIPDGADLNQTVTDLNGIGIGGEDLTAILKRKDPEVPEPFPEGTRYIVIPDDSRGLEIAVAFAAVFAVSGLLFAFTTPEIGAILFIFFIALAAILATATFTRVGVTPILMDIEAPAEESGFWNDEFERGKVLVFASTEDRRTLEAAWEVFRRQNIYFDIIGGRLKPRPLSGAVLHHAAVRGDERPVEEAGQASGKS
ncbi:MAG TPA: hypothetical protein VFJ72_02710 [Rubrobacteraceae bacterium]|nr:hypothetical protein [Rubrobacteraceae bacterium]